MKKLFYNSMTAFLALFFGMWIVQGVTNSTIELVSGNPLTRTPGPHTRVPTWTVTKTPTNTPSRTATKTPTRTPTKTITPTGTTTKTVTPTRTRTSTKTPTKTYTFTRTITPTPTNTKTPSTTFTPSNSPTNSPTNTITPLSTNTPSNTPTNSPTNTITNTFTKTATNTPSPTPSNTPTNTPTNTPSPTPTNTPAFTNTPTACPTLGDSNIEANQVDFTLENVAMPITAAGPATITDVVIYAARAISSGYACALYSDSGNSPNTSIAQSTPQTFSGGVTTWTQINFDTPVAVSAGTYWIVVGCNQTFNIFRSSTGGPSSSQLNGGNLSIPFTSPWVYDGSARRNVSLYAHVCQ